MSFFIIIHESANELTKKAVLVRQYLQRLDGRLDTSRDQCLCRN